MTDQLVVHVLVPALIMARAAWVDLRTYRIPDLWGVVLVAWALYTQPDLEQALISVLVMAGVMTGVGVLWRLGLFSSKRATPFRGAKEPDALPDCPINSISGQGNRPVPLTQGGLGWGDIKIALACALYLPPSGVGLFVALAGTVAIAMTTMMGGAIYRPAFSSQKPHQSCKKQGIRHQVIPFGPALAIAFWICLCYYQFG